MSSNIRLNPLVCVLLLLPASSAVASEAGGGVWWNDQHPPTPSRGASWGFDQANVLGGSLEAKASWISQGWRDGGALKVPAGGGLLVADRPEFHLETFTVSAWIFPDAACIQQKDAWAVSRDRNYRLGLHQGYASVRLFAWATETRTRGKWQHVTDTSTPIPQGKWTHIATTYDGKDLLLFVNGRQVARKTVTLKLIDAASAGDVMIGCSRYSGMIDQVVADGDVRAISPVDDPQLRLATNDCFVRIKLQEPNSASFRVTLGAGIAFKPETEYYSLVADDIPEWAQLTPGQWSPWVNIRSLIDYSQNVVALRFHNCPATSELKAVVEFASSPDAEGQVKSFEETLNGRLLGYVIPLNLGNNAEVVSVRQASIRRHEAISRISLAGRRPSRIRTIASMEGYGLLYDDQELAQQEMENLVRLGFNTFSPGACLGIMAAARKAGLDGIFALRSRFSFKSYTPFDVWQGEQQNRSAWCRAYWDSADCADRIVISKLSDEPKALDSVDLANCEDANKRYQAFLEEQGLEPSFLGLKHWSQARLNTESPNQLLKEGPPDLIRARNFYWTRRFCTDLTCRYIARGAEIERAHFPGVKTTVNLNPPFPGILPVVPDWFTLGRDGLDMLWTEDYTSPRYGSGIQASAYMMDLLRSAARARNLPIGVHDTTAGNSAHSMRLKTYSMLARCPAAIHYYSISSLFGMPYGPSVGRNWIDEPEMAAEIGALNHEIGQVEDFLADGKPAEPRIAILYSGSTEYWRNPWSDPQAAWRLNHEMTYYALLHSHLPVTFIDETAVIGGKLEDYKVLYITQPMLRRDAAAAVAQWVKDGGTLNLCAGAARWDEYAQPLNTLDELAGLARGDLAQQPVAALTSLAKAQKLDELTLDGGQSMPLLGVVEQTQVLAGDWVTVLGKLKEQRPGLVRSHVGRGRVLYVAGLPGLTYHQQAQRQEAMIKRSPDSPRNLLAMAAREATVQPPIAASEPMVEVGLVRAANGWLILLANYTFEPIGEVQLTLNDWPGHAVAPTTLSGAACIVDQPKGSAPILKLPIKQTEMIILPFSALEAVTPAEVHIQP
ncbi:MAG: hypothetical protein GXY38_10585 [Planctomycetes bacterium]|nr:hypothetical protein [Planctomycetota bacterium]